MKNVILKSLYFFYLECNCYMDVGICSDLYLINYFGNVDYFYNEEI